MAIIRSLVQVGGSTIRAQLRATNTLAGVFFAPSAATAVQRANAVAIPSIYCNAQCTRSVCRTRPNRKSGRTPSAASNREGTSATTSMEKAPAAQSTDAASGSSPLNTTSGTNRNEEQKEPTVQPVLPVSATQSVPSTAASSAASAPLASSSASSSSSSGVPSMAVRDPNNWLYKQLIRTSSQFWNKTIMQLNNAAEKGNQLVGDRLNNGKDTTSNTTRSLPPMDEERAKQMAMQDMANIQAKASSVLQQVQQRAKPLWCHAKRALTAGKTAAVQALKQLERTNLGQKFSEPVRRFLQESCEATQERAKYESNVGQMSSKSESGSCSSSAAAAPVQAGAASCSGSSTAAVPVCSSCGKPKK